VPHKACGKQHNLPFASSCPALDIIGPRLALCLSSSQPESEGNMAGEVSAVVVTIEVKLPKSNLIKVEEVLVDGAGTLSEALQGGQSKYQLTLTQGRDLKPIKKGEQVFVRGMREGGNQFKLPGPLEAGDSHKPWTFAGTFGSTGL